MKVVCTHIDWDISEEDLVDNFGDTVDKDGLPYTAKDLGLPTWDEEVVLELDDDDWEDVSSTGDEDEFICNELSEEYNWLINSFSWEMKNDQGTD